MFVKRQKQLIDYVETTLKADVTLVMSPIHIYYFTGFLSNPHERFFALYVDAKRRKTTLFLPELDEEAANQVAIVDELRPVSDSENPYTVLKNTIKNKIYTTAIEKSYVSVLRWERLKEVYPNSLFVDVEPYIHGERAKKSKEEIEYVKKAIDITEKGLHHTIEALTPGITELQVKAELEYQLTILGADGLAFDSLVLSGENTAFPHGASGNRRIEVGDLLLCDLGVHINGYHSDITRTFVVGKSTDQQKEIYDTVKNANERAIAKVKTGTPMKDIDLIARTYIAEQGYGKYFTHRIGHGLGLEAHEPPSLHLKNEEEIQSGLLFTIEPGIYIPGIGGVRIEDNLYIHEDGEVEVLTTFPKTFIEI